MKLFNILGAVIVVHVAVLVLAIAIPGCRNTERATTLSPETTYPATADLPNSEGSAMSDRDLNPAVDAEGADSTRFSPTRPMSPLADALQPAQIETGLIAAEAYTVEHGDSLWSLAKKNDLTVGELAQANGLPADARLRLGQVLVIPAQPVPLPAAPESAAGAESRNYRIQPGDTLGKIARVHGTTVAQLKSFNDMRGDMLRSGDVLAIPESTVANPASVIAPRPTASEAALAAAPAGAFKHTVASGESLTLIANRYGVKIGEIALANKIRDPSLIRSGQELIIPGQNLRREGAAADVPTTGDNEDLDTGFGDEDLDDVPVINVEEPVKTLSTNDGPTVFE